jgi:prephenate dehydrogenase
VASFGKIVVVGAGLIGGSFALALRQAGAVSEIVGVGRTPATLEAARQRGLIDRAAPMAEAARDADLVLLAAPVAQTEALLRELAPHLHAGCLVTDAGSVKGEVVAAAKRALGEAAGQFVPAHPIAGSDASGPAAARADLFRDRLVVLTPMAENAPAAVERVRQAWALCGAQTRTMSALQHDAVFASVSHLPHLLAFAYMAAVAQSEDATTRLALAGSGFRDFTRIAGSHPEMWRDIALGNREALLRELNAFRAVLDHAAARLEANDGAALEQLFERASRARRAWNSGGQDS